MEITHQEISEKAFKIWEREGKPEGREREHWLQAEEELRKQNSGRSKRNKRLQTT